jgi:hypothetical protein
MPQFARYFVVVFVVAAFASGQALTLLPTADATLFEDPLGALADGAGASFFVGKTNNAGSGARRGLLRFDLAANIPPGFVVVSATLVLHMTAVNGNPTIVALHRADGPWSEGPTDAGFPGGGGAPSQPGDATWLHANYPAAPWISPGGDFASSPAATFAVVGPGAYVLSADATLLADLQDQLDRPAANFGWLLKTTTETAGIAKRFASRENVGLEPVLQIVAAPPVYASAAAYGSGCAIAPGAAPFALAANGAPMLGSAGFSAALTHGPPGGTSWIFLAGASGGGTNRLGSCEVLLNETSAAAFVAVGASPLGPLPLDANGAAALPLPVPLDPSLAGFFIYGQALCVGGSSLVLSNGLALVFGI